MINVLFAGNDKVFDGILLCVLSILKRTTTTEPFGIYIMTMDVSHIKPEYTALTEYQAQLLDAAVKGYNPESFVKRLDVRKQYDEAFADCPNETAYCSPYTLLRLLADEMDVIPDKILYLDADIMFNRDITLLYNHDVTGYEYAAARDHYGKYIINHNYINAGVLLLNMEMIRKTGLFSKARKMLKERKLLFADQSAIYRNTTRKLMLPQRYNDQKYLHAHTVVRHFSKRLFYLPYPHTENLKQWQIDKVHDKFGYDQFDDIYEEFMRIMQDSEVEVELTGRRAVLEKIAQYEREGRFDEDVEDDPPSKVLLPDDIDYTSNPWKKKVTTSVAYTTARIFLNKMIKEKKFIIKEYRGLENFKNLQGGAVITCNHFNAFDSFAMDMLYDQTEFRQRGKKMYRIIKEGNYTSFPGFFGFLMRNCNTLPLSSNKETMRKLLTAVDEILSDGDFILVYPEQSMWWNYRKPKPLKKGAYKFAAKNNVPVLPVFITMEDSDIDEGDGFFVQQYTIHVGKPIYPDKDMNITDNSTRMLEGNYEWWKSVYEDFYGIPLEYTCGPVDALGSTGKRSVD